MLKYELSDDIDVTMEFCFGESHNRVEAPAFDPSYFNDAHAGAAMIKLNSQFPWLPKIALSIPESIAEHLGEGLKGHVGQRRVSLTKYSRTSLLTSSATQSHDQQSKTAFI